MTNLAFRGLLGILLLAPSAWAAEGEMRDEALECWKKPPFKNALRLAEGVIAKIERIPVDGGGRGANCYRVWINTSEGKTESIMVSSTPGEQPADGRISLDGKKINAADLKAGMLVKQIRSVDQRNAEIRFTIALSEEAQNRLKNDVNFEPQKQPVEAIKHASLAAYPGAIVTVQDAASGNSFAVTPDGQSVEAKDAKGAVLWKVKLASGKEIGTPVVRHLAITAGGLDAVVGKHDYFTIDLKTGKILKQMAD